ncbi:hypothetical protein [Bacillus sp. Marseille-Q3570]|uniref:hypothetical protein n=1 Tax=Bacillus sp. Marseille-Q3570 TaxID=2963522 RepID=UPI0021B778A7|nr:hypothetical protein [Bacillus sp. Marseille-Q3570]
MTMTKFRTVNPSFKNQRIGNITKATLKGAVQVVARREPSIEEIEKMLGIDQVRPIQLTPSDAEDMMEKEEELREWYEDDLKELYRETLAEEGSGSDQER